MSDANPPVALEDERTIILAKPIKLGEITYGHLDLREPNAGELEKAQQATTAVGGNITLIAIIAKIPPAAVKMMSTRDFAAAVDYLSSFMQGGPETGAS